MAVSILFKSKEINKGPPGLYFQRFPNFGIFLKFRVSKFEENSENAVFYDALVAKIGLAVKNYVERSFSELWG